MPNTLLRRVPRAEMNAFLQTRFDRSMRIYDDATQIEVGANAPEVIEWYYESFYKKIFYGGRVDVVSMEILRNRLAHEHGCVYCQMGDAEAARSVGITDEQLDHIMDDDAPCFSPKHRAVLKFARQMALTNMEGELSPELHDELKAHFDDGQIYNMGVAAAVLTGWAKMIFVLDTVEKTASCPVRPRRPVAQAAE
ncbi:MAG: carboxymuconolactone decarboxylase family protein [Alphaproteobacteria bacterium]|nr:carboxymuconolactone decarboxylase family protein [Alphaproteobacteria bacterium]